MPGDPHSGSKVWKAPDREIGKPGENRRKVITYRDLQPPAAFHEREHRRNFRSRLWAADVDPVFSSLPQDAGAKTMAHFGHRIRSKSIGHICAGEIEHPHEGNPHSVRRDLSPFVSIPGPWRILALPYFHVRC